MENFETLVARQADIIITNCEKAKKVEFPECVVLEIPKLSNYDLVKLHEKLDNTKYINCIYVIYSDDFKYDKEKINEIFNNKKYSFGSKYYHISKINDSKQWTNGNTEKAIYVGSKEKDLTQRIAQHLGIVKTAGRSVYSLYLKDWWNDHSKIILKIWNFKGTIDYNVLQIIEDALWEEIQPLFGKKGATFNKKRNN
jgi:hypothetical protein